MAPTPKLPPSKAIAASTAKQRMLKQLICSNAPEEALRYHGFRQIAGVDEVGRGALFGPVVAAAVILPKAVAALASAGLKDSKQMLRADRERLDRRIRRVAVAFAIAEVDAATIDRVNIYQATRLAMLQAVLALPCPPDHLLIDALRIDHHCPQTKLFYGDALCLSIAAASVIAKVHRDALMRELHQQHPLYGLASHKGYATPEHRRALLEHGPTPLHRQSFAPVRLATPGAPALSQLDFDEAFAAEDLLLEAEALDPEDLESADLSLASEEAWI